MSLGRLDVSGCRQSVISFVASSKESREDGRNGNSNAGREEGRNYVFTSSRTGENLALCVCQ